MILPDENSLSELIHAPLSNRSRKPRRTGVTMVIDKGLGTNDYEDLLDTASSHIDIVKFGFGTACLYPMTVLKRKLNLSKLYDVQTCTGGTLGEVAMTQNQYPQFVELCLNIGFTAIEISDGTISLERSARDAAIRQVAKGAVAVTEVGKKLDEFPSPEVVVDTILRDFDAGASYVIIEGRESGESAGIYDEAGRLAEETLDRLVQLLPGALLKRIMWEAPKKSQQVALLKRFGVNVNLGNIAPSEAIALECLRTGLRGDTFAWSL